MPKVLILGAGGRFGRACTAAFQARGWTVHALSRRRLNLPTGVTPIHGHARDGNALTRAMDGCDLAVNALNPAYHRWHRDLPPITDAVIHAARRTGATVLLPGTVYTFGAGMPPRLREDTPERPTTEKGHQRLALERRYAEAGIRTILLRGGDFIDDAKTGIWFDGQIAAKLDRGFMTYPGAMDIPHAWAWLPDMAQAAAMLADRRDALPDVAAFNFPGYALTGDEMKAALERVTGRPLRLARVPWRLIGLLGTVAPQLRAVHRMRYLWSVPHAIDGTKLRATIPDWRPTPLDEALSAALAGLSR